MGQRNDDSTRRGVTRRQMFGLAAGALLAAFPRTARADLFGGDVGILLAQLEQMLTMVVKAAETVQGIMATVDRVQRVYENGQVMLRKVTGQEGLRGFVSGVRDLANSGRMATRNLQTLNVRGGQWMARIKENHGDLSSRDVWQMTIEATDLNRRFLRDAVNIHASFGQVAQSFAALDQLQEITAAAETVDGLVGQSMLIGRSIAQLGVIATQHSSAATTHAQLYTSELERKAMEREMQRKLSEDAWKDFDKVKEQGPTDVRWELGE
jgi:hypothetical protein